jgi:RNase P/RNase MRP subunit POP5
MDNLLLIHKTSNGFSVNPLLIVSNEISGAAKSATDKFIAKKSKTINLHPIFVIVDSVAKLF